jgi:hypothetical protein
MGVIMSSNFLIFMEEHQPFTQGKIGRQIGVRRIMKVLGKSIPLGSVGTGLLKATRI